MAFLAVVLVVLEGTLASPGQSASSPTQLVHPVLKDPNHRYAPTSLDRDPSLSEDQNQNQIPKASRPGPVRAAVAPAQPAVIAAKIDSGLAASKLAMIGTMDGLKGTIYVTNIGAEAVTPVVQLAVCDQKGFKIGTASKSGAPLAPKADERIVIVATNLNATDLKLMRLTSAGAK
jgi:hypothetical protein